MRFSSADLKTVLMELAIGVSAFGCFYGLGYPFHVPQKATLVSAPIPAAFFGSS